MAVKFNINNPDSCQRAYLNYHCYGNTMNISPADMGAILAHWGDKVETWEKSAEANDSVDYEFDNSDFEKYKEQYSGNGNCVGGEITRGVLDASSAGAGIILRKTAKDTFKKAGKEMADNTVKHFADKTKKVAIEKGPGKALDKAAAKSAEKSSKVTAESGAQTIGCIVGCTMAFATGLSYTIKQPNKEEMQVVNELNNKMSTAQANLATQQNEMASAQQEIITKVGEAEAANEEADAYIAEQEATQQFNLNIINAIKAKQESGIKLTASERALFNDSVKLLNDSNTAQSNAGTSAQDKVAGLYSEIEGKQSVYDTAADSISDIQGMTQYAESMDTATAVSTGIEAAAQGLNVISGGKSAWEAAALATSGSWAFGATAWAWAFVAMGAAGAAMSVAGVAQQGTYLKQALSEIDNRKVTQGLNTETQEIHNQEVDAFAGSMSYVEELDYEIPELDDTSDLVLAQDKPEEPVVKKKTTKEETV